MKTPNGSPNSSRKCKWDRAIVALVEGATMDKAATAAGVNVATLYRWQNNPEFQEALQEARSECRHEALEQSTRRREQDVILATAALREIATNPDLPAGARVHAAKCLIAQQSPKLEKTRDTYYGLSTIPDAELDQQIQEDREHMHELEEHINVLVQQLKEHLKAIDAQKTEEPQVDKADAVEPPPSGPSPNPVPPPTSTSSGTATPTWRTTSPPPQAPNPAEVRNSKRSFANESWQDYCK